MDKKRTVKVIKEWRIIEVRGIGRPSFRRENYVREDLGKTKIQNWSKMAFDREAWNRNGEQKTTQKESERQQKFCYDLIITQI
jgi:hypothetical protein